MSFQNPVPVTQVTPPPGGGGGGGDASASNQQLQITEAALTNTKLDALILLTTNLYNLLNPFQQVFTVPSLVWNVAHNKGTYPIVSTIDSSGNLINGTVSYPDLNNVTIVFTSAQTGTAICSV